MKLIDPFDYRLNDWVSMALVGTYALLIFVIMMGVGVLTVFYPLVGVPAIVVVLLATLWVLGVDHEA